MLKLENVVKVFEEGNVAVKDFSYSFKEKEFVVLAGPSGSGKTTLLKMIAGLEDVSGGRILIDGADAKDIHIKDRDIAMMFQSFSLLPHLTVYENLAFGLKIRKTEPSEIEKRVLDAASMLNISPLLSKKPKELTLLEQKKAALCRVLVRDPKIFILDEPLEDLDEESRMQMRLEILRLYNKCDAVFIYATQDNKDALSMGEKVLLLKNGEIMQTDFAQNIYDNPQNLFAASFFGVPQMNFFDAQIVKEDNKLYAKTSSFSIEIPPIKARKIDDAYIDSAIIFGVRAEDIHDEQVFIENSPSSVFFAVIEYIESLGSETLLYLKNEAKESYIFAKVDSRNKYKVKDKIRLAFNAKYIHYFDPHSGASLLKPFSKLYFQAKLTRNALIYNGESYPLYDGFKALPKDETLDFSIPADDISVEVNAVDEKSYLKMNVRVQFVEKTAENFIVYFKNKNLYSVKLPLTFSVSEGDTLTLYLDYSKMKAYLNEEHQFAEKRTK